mmetsp:Transcript_25651/g.57661  ORF Transcript_25651/g.57661 Transcript_25651/m.57661 type:complete len:170 (-) Transcript_25651:403-912(-)
MNTILSLIFQLALFPFASRCASGYEELPSNLEQKQTIVGHQALLALSELCSKRMFAIASDRDVVVSSRRLLRPAMNKLAKDGRMLFPCGRHAASQRKRTTTVTSKSLRKERIVHLEGQSEQQQGASGEKNLDSYSFCQGGVKTQNDASVLSNLSSSVRVSLTAVLGFFI